MSISESVKIRIAGKQHFQCNNKPELPKLENYTCPLWQRNSDNKGNFDEEGYIIDLINEKTMDNNMENLQALCPYCYAYKTRKYMTEKIIKNKTAKSERKIHNKIENNDDSNENNNDENNDDDNNDNNSHENNDSYEDSDDNDDDSGSEDHDTNKKIIIDSYNNFMKCTPINKIIITNKTKKLGYIKFKNRLWYKLYDKNEAENNPEKTENLEGFLLNYHEKFLFKHTGENNFEPIELEYNWKKIINDISNNCYVKQLKKYVLKYHEYIIVSKSTKNNSQIVYKLLDTIDFKFHNIDILGNKIITGKCCGNRILNIYKNINTNIVDMILNSLIINTVELKKFKILCYNVIVKQLEPIIFYDYSDKWGLLTTWLGDILYTISSENYYLNSDDYYNNIDNCQKKIKNGIYRYVIIKPHPKNDIKKMIDDFKNLEIKNIIVVCKDKTKNIYDIDRFKNFLKNNKKLILSKINNEDTKKHYDNDIIDGHMDNIFYKTDYLLTDFLKWICES